MPEIIKPEENIKKRSEQNKNQDVPVNTDATDDVIKTSKEIGINQAKIQPNVLRPGIENVDFE